MGAWTTYGLGAETEDLPGFVVLTSLGRGGQNQPIAARQWAAGLLPSRFQGVQLRGKGDPVLYLSTPAGITHAQQKDVVDAINTINAKYYGIDPESGKEVRPVGPQTNLSGLRTAVERSLRNRGTRFVVVDQAAHMMRQCHPSRLVEQFNTLKSLSNEYHVQWILLGSYDLFELVSLSAQLARRTHVIHFGRYREDVAEDVRSFRGCLKKLGESMPALKELDLLRYAEVFHQNTLGCVGTLRTVLVRLNLLVAEKDRSEDTLCKALLTEAQDTQITREIVEGEERIAPGLKRNLAVQQPQTGRRVA